MRRLTFAVPMLVLFLAGLACVFPLAVGSAPAAPPTLAPAVVVQPSAVPQPEPATSGASAVDLAGLYQRAAPGVVTILNFASLGAPHDQAVPVAEGSGFVIDTQGHIVTNQHVVDGADQIEVDFPSGLKAWAKKLGTDPDSDLAVLMVDVPTDSLVPLPLGDSDQVRVGDTVFAIGDPFGLSGTMTGGIVSAIGRTADSERATPGGQPYTAGGIIQTDAAINPGNSGGPLLNQRGEVIGVNRLIATQSFTVSGDAANSGVGFAVPVNIVKRVVPALIRDGKYDYPYLGISSLGDRAWNLKTLEVLKLPPDARGVYVTCVNAGGPADKAGMIGAGRCDQDSLGPGGDLITALDGNPVRDFSEMITYLVAHTQVGQAVTVTVLRAGKEINLQLTIGARP